MTKAVTDQTGRKILLPDAPTRIISLVPSQTELLFHLGLTDEVAGITRFCVHPAAWHGSKKRIGGTKALNIPAIRALAPDLIIANKEENVKEQVEELALSVPVYVSDVNNLPDAFEMIEQVSTLINQQAKGNTLIDTIKKEFSSLLLPSRKPRVCYLIWQKPFMTVGGDTFIHAMLEAAGFENIFRNCTRYPEISLEQLPDLQCELLLLSTEPFPFNHQHAAELAGRLPGIKPVLVNGELFCWYGSRLLEAPRYFQQLHSQLAD